MMIMALYLRLSKEDGYLVDESNSITNQRYRLRSYLEDIPELKHYQIKEYVDDGYSGKNFDRPGVTQLLEDVKSGKVYGIAVKDLSRFGRNHVEVGNYIEKIFPLLDVRFIAVNNHFDSADYLGTTPDMDVSFQNLMYDYFSVENSIKIKNDLFSKRTRGKYMATFAPYGYKKSEKDHNRLLPDEDAAEVARYLNDKNIPTPQEYAKRKGIAEHWKYCIPQKGSRRGGIKEDGLIRIVKDAIIRQAVLAADLKELLKLHNDMVKQQEQRLEEERVKIQDKLQKYKNENFALYERYKAGEIGN